jgi:hypothetical protein
MRVPVESSPVFGEQRKIIQVGEPGAARHRGWWREFAQTVERLIHHSPALGAGDAHPLDGERLGDRTGTGHAGEPRIGRVPERNDLGDALQRDAADMERPGRSAERGADHLGPDIEREELHVRKR